MASNGKSMKAALFVPDTGNLEKISGLRSRLLASGVSLYELHGREDLEEDTDFIIAVGGDGTFLSAAAISSDREIPVVGVNFGRLGFLSENRWETVCDALLDGNYTIEKGNVLTALCGGTRFHAFNDIYITRGSGPMMGVDVTIDDVTLPTYWADGLLVATSAGSTAYSLSVGGPIVMPGSDVLIISPISPHNLNVRPLVVPSSSSISLRCRSRADEVILSADNSSMTIPGDSRIDISLARFSLKRVRPSGSNFIGALVGKLHWGEDSRN
ncbi:MAG: NAD(+)/NADH kinase [Bacteroidales bacterium]|nr:NAD(+)/NADH kinase [Bacteroidales bacterium]